MPCPRVHTGRFVNEAERRQHTAHHDELFLSALEKMQGLGYSYMYTLSPESSPVQAGWLESLLSHASGNEYKIKRGTADNPHSDGAE